jgi:hypothetical protein
VQSERKINAKEKVYNKFHQQPLQAREKNEKKIIVQKMMMMMMMRRCGNKIEDVRDCRSPLIEFYRKHFVFLCRSMIVGMSWWS